MEVVVDVLEDLAGDVFLGEVHGFVADVVNVVLDLVPALEGEDERSGHVADVDEGPLESPLVDDQVAVVDGLIGEVVGHEVEPHPVADAERGGEAVGDAVAGVEHHLLGRGLGFAVERDGGAGRLLVANVVGDRAVDAAGRGEEKLLVGLAVAEQVGGPVDVDRLGELGLFLAGGVADDGREMNDRIHPVEGRLGDGRVADVALDQLEEAIRATGQEAMAAELERVDDPNAVSLLEEHGDHGRADVTGSAGNEYSHRGLHPWWLETRLERRGCWIGDRGGKARRGVQHARPSSLRPFPLCCSG